MSFSTRVSDLKLMIFQAWYGNKASYEYERFSTDEAVTLFKQLGLNSEFWTT